MLIGTIRPRETTTVDVQGHSLAEVHDVLDQQTPAGFQLTDAPVRMSNGTTLLSAAGTFARRDNTHEIEAVDMASLRAQVPTGWVLLNVRSV